MYIRQRRMPIPSLSIVQRNTHNEDDQQPSISAARVITCGIFLFWKKKISVLNFRDNEPSESAGVSAGGRAATGNEGKRILRFCICHHHNRAGSSAHTWCARNNIARGSSFPLFLNNNAGLNEIIQPELLITFRLGRVTLLSYIRFLCV